MITAQEKERYSRQIMIEEIGENGQIRLASSKVLVVGAGGLGSAILYYLAAAGIGTIGIIDDEEVELSNLQRQILHTTLRIGMPKVESARIALEALNPEITVVPYCFRLEKPNAKKIIEQYDIVVTALVVLLLFVSLLLFSGCQQQNTDATDNQTTEITVTDDSGAELTLENNPERIVSLTPSNTEILFALGLGERVVGVTTYCDYPEEAKEKPKLGDLEGNVEEIVAMKADLVVAKVILNDNIVSKLRDLDIPVLCVDPESLDGVYRAIELISKVTGTESRGDELTSEMKEKIAAVEEKVASIPEAERLKVFIEVGNEPLFTAGAKTSVDEIVTLAGGINIAGDVEGYQMYSVESVVKNNPDVIMALDSYYVDVETEIKKRSGWDTIKAVQEGNLITEPDNLLNRPGPRSADAVETVAKELYPDLF
jgi:iron complex transport system substrate-binding protein